MNVRLFLFVTLGLCSPDFHLILVAQMDLTFVLQYYDHHLVSRSCRKLSQTFALPVKHSAQAAEARSERRILTISITGPFDGESDKIQVDSPVKLLALFSLSVMVHFSGICQEPIRSRSSNVSALLSKNSSIIHYWSLGRIF